MGAVVGVFGSWYVGVCGVFLGVWALVGAGGEGGGGFGGRCWVGWLFVVGGGGGGGFKDSFLVSGLVVGGG